jgi:4'-phosphopantetheinyl transferase
MSKAAPPSFQIEPVVTPARGRVAASPLLPLQSLSDRLESGAAQLIFLSLDEAHPTLLELVPMLSESERARVDRAADEALAVKFVLGRWLLRSVLGAVLGITPEALQLMLGAQGKPALTGDMASGLAFNLAHSGAWAVLAIARGARVGVDIEQERPLVDADRLARRILTARELRSYRARAERGREAGLLAAWVRKEAVLKALGTGVSGGPSSIETGIDPVGSGDLNVLDGAGSRWWAGALSLPPGYLGALALEGGPRPILAWQAWPTN